MPRQPKEAILNIQKPSWLSLQAGERLLVQVRHTVADAEANQIIKALKKFPASRVVSRHGYMSGLNDVLRARKYEKVYVFDFLDGSKTYAFIANLNFPGFSERQVILVDMFNDTTIGEGVIRTSTVDNMTFQKREHKIAPFVSWTFTRPEFEKQGLNERRLEVMNNVAQAEFGLPLHSGQRFETPEAEKTWQRLVKNGRAMHELTQEWGTNAYRFKI